MFVTKMTTSTFSFYSTDMRFKHHGEAQKELRALLDKIKEYKGLDAEARTDERRSQNTADMARIAEIEADLKDLGAD